KVPVGVSRTGTRRKAVPSDAWRRRRGRSTGPASTASATAGDQREQVGGEQPSGGPTRTVAHLSLPGDRPVRRSTATGMKGRVDLEVFASDWVSGFPPLSEVAWRNRWASSMGVSTQPESRAALLDSDSRLRDA